MKFKSLVLAAGLAALAGTALADGHAAKVKVGMITTLSGGGAGLGIDVRDGFMLAAKMAGNDNLEVVIEDDQRKPEIAVQLADKMIQSEKVDVMTGIIWSNLAMAVVPAATAQGKFYLSPNAGPSALWQAKAVSPFYFNVSWQNDNIQRSGRCGWANDNRHTRTQCILMAPNYPAGQDMIDGLSSASTKAIWSRRRSIPSWARPTMPPRSPRCGRQRCRYNLLSSCPVAWGFPFMKQYAGSGVDLPNVMGPAFSFRPRYSGGNWRCGLGCEEHQRTGPRTSTMPGNAERSWRRFRPNMTVFHRCMRATGL